MTAFNTTGIVRLRAILRPPIKVSGHDYGLVTVRPAYAYPDSAFETVFSMGLTRLPGEPDILGAISLEARINRWNKDGSTFAMKVSNVTCLQDAKDASAFFSAYNRAQGTFLRAGRTLWTVAQQIEPMAKALRVDDVVFHREEVLHSPTASALKDSIGRPFMLVDPALASAIIEETIESWRPLLDPAL